jgi:membrane-associated phospholipid phosphatase
LVEVRQKSRKERIAGLVSILLNPLWSGALIFIILAMKPEYSRGEAIAILLSSFSAVIILPVLILAYLSRIGKAENIDVPDRRQRLLPFALFVLIYATNAVFNALLQLPILFQAIIWMILINTIIYGIITVWWKVSIHAAVLAGFIVFLFYITGNYALWPLLLLIPLVAWSRIILKAHTAAQVIVGAVLGLLLTSGQLLFYHNNIIK